MSTKANVIYYNNGEEPIFIITKISADLFGGPAKRETIYCVAPGEGIDLSILTLTMEKPKEILMKSQFESKE